MKNAIKLDPLSLISNTNLGTIYYFKRNYPQALVQFRQTLEIEPDFVVGLQWLARTLEMNDSVREALEVSKRILNQLPDDAEALASHGHVLALSSQRNEALKILERLSQMRAIKYVSYYWDALVRVALDDKSGALEDLGKAVAERFDWLNFLSVEPMIDPLRSEPGFEQILKRMLPLEN